MSRFLRIFRHLLPNARAWRLPVEPATIYAITSNSGSLYTSGDGSSTSGAREYVKSIYNTMLAPARYLYKFFRGLAEYPEVIKSSIDLVYLDVFPETTREIDRWVDQFNLTVSNAEEDKRAAVSAAWKSQGGQGLDYLQDILHSAGFTNVFIHEWWTDIGGGAHTTKDPFTYIDAPNNPLPGGGFLLVNKGPTVAEKLYGVYMEAPDSDFGSIESEFTDVEGFTFIPVEYDLPTDSNTWPYFIYVGAQTFPNHAEIDVNRQLEFERLLLAYFPNQQWIGALIDYV